MNLPVVLDESVSLHVLHRLTALGFSVSSIAQNPKRGMPDEEVFLLAKNPPALLITRDYHFTNSIRFDPSHVGAILFIDDGNLIGTQEADLVENFLATHVSELFSGRLVILKPSGYRIR